MANGVAVAAHPWIYASTCEDYNPLPIAGRIFSDMSYAGLDGIELMHTMLVADHAVDTLAALSEQHALPVIGASFGGAMWNAEEESAILTSADAVTAKLAALGGVTLGISTGAAPRRKSSSDLDQQARVLAQVSAMCSGRGITMNLHNHTYEVQDGEYELTETLARVPEVRLGPDVDWLTRAGIVPVDFIRRHAERIVFLHIRDNLSGRWVESVGEGEMDFAAIREALDETGLPEHIAIELAWESGFEATRPLRETLRMSRNHIRETMGW